MRQGKNAGEQFQDGGNRGTLICKARHDIFPIYTRRHPCYGHELIHLDESAPMLTVSLYCLGAVFALFFMLWLLSLKLRDASIVDMVWGFGFVVIGWIAFVTGGGAFPRRLLMVTMVTLWGLRLTAYLTWRNLGKGEDYRYQAMRQRYGERFPIVSLSRVFGLQSFVMWLVSFPVQAAQVAKEPAELGILDFVGVGLWAIGLFFEAVGDAQLARFTSALEHGGFAEGHRSHRNGRDADLILYAMTPDGRPVRRGNDKSITPGGPDTYYSLRFSSSRPNTPPLSNFAASRRRRDRTSIRSAS